ncbi:MAG: hypothetical protein NTX21_03295 [Alphaproteobacteria bacterium]|nr:hypothetical protein [Alphaproteobacteria bacterium]
MIAIGQLLSNLAIVEAPHAAARLQQRAGFEALGLGILGRRGIGAIVGAAASIDADEQITLPVQGYGMISGGQAINDRLGRRGRH